jgi:protein-tyrosine phosphatase
LIDIHCHIIPKIDDGATSLEDSEKMLRGSMNSNIDVVYATPHYMKGYCESSYLEIEMKVKKLNEYIKSKSINLKVLPGQEVCIDKYTVDLYKQGTIKGLNASKYMLVELSATIRPIDSLSILYELMLLGVKPILAHPERYKWVIKNPSLINDFIEEGVLLQIDTGSIKGVFGRQTRYTSEQLIRHGLCSFIATDAHNGERGSTSLSAAINLASKFNKDIEITIIRNSLAVLGDVDLIKHVEGIRLKKSI